MRFKWRVFKVLLGDSFIEPYRLDSILESLADGEPMENLDEYPDSIKWDVPRVLELLTVRAFIKPVGDGYIITSEGKLHLDRGGYLGEILRARGSFLSLWLSIVAVILSIMAYFR